VNLNHKIKNFTAMTDLKNLKYFALSSAVVVQFNYKPNIQTLISDVNVIRDHKMSNCKVMVCYMFKISSGTRERKERYFNSSFCSILAD